MPLRATKVLTTWCICDSDCVCVCVCTSQTVTVSVFVQHNNKAAREKKIRRGIQQTNWRKLKAAPIGSCFMFCACVCTKVLKYFSNISTPIKE